MLGLVKDVVKDAVRDTAAPLKQLHKIFYSI